MCLPARGDLVYELLGPCARCSELKVRCDKVLGCSRCKKHGDCEPSRYDITTRCRMLSRGIFTSVFTHNDLSKYQLSMQANVFGCRPCLGRGEMKDVLSRLEESGYGKNTIPVGIISHLPDELKSFIGDHSTYKIEWMVNGKYVCSMSESYGDNFLTEQEIIGIARVYAYPPKLVDTCGLNEYEMGYKIWLETLFHPLNGVVYNGSGYWKAEKEVAWTTVRMISAVINHEYIVTVTTIGRSVTVTM